MDVSATVQKRIEHFLHCKKPRGWHHAAAIHRFAPHILALVEQHNASFAEIAFYLRTNHRVRFSRQRLHAYYHRISSLIPTFDTDTDSSTSAPRFSLPAFDVALSNIRELRIREYWRLRTPLLSHISVLTGLREAYDCSYAELAEHLAKYYSLHYSRQAICQFLKRNSQPSIHRCVIEYWGETGKI